MPSLRGLRVEIPDVDVGELGLIVVVQEEELVLRLHQHLQLDYNWVIVENDFSLLKLMKSLKRISDVF